MFNNVHIYSTIEKELNERWEPYAVSLIMLMADRQLSGLETEVPVDRTADKIFEKGVFENFVIENLEIGGIFTSVLSAF